MHVVDAGTMRLEGLRWRETPARAFDSLRNEWDAIARSLGDVPFLQADFLSPLLQHFGGGSERVFLGMRGDVPVVAAILGRARTGVWETFQPSQLPLGAVIAVPGVPIDSLVRALLRRLPATVLQLGITQLDPRLFPRPNNAGSVRSIDFVETAWIELDGEFTDFWDARGKNLKKGLAKQRRELGSSGVRIELDVLTTPDEVQSGLNDYAVLECAGWKEAMGTAIRLDQAQGRFYAAMLSNYAKRGAARVYRYRFNGKPVAVNLCIEAESTQVVLKTTYDESIRRYSPAFLMQQQVLEMEWRLGRIKRLEFYGKRMEWHTRWTESCRTLYHLNVYRLPLIARCHSVGRRLVRAFRARMHPGGGLSSNGASDVSAAVGE